MASSPALDKYGYLAGEPASDMLGGESWRTPGINPEAGAQTYHVYKGLFDRKGKEVSQEEYEAAKAKNPLAVKAGEATGLIREKAKEKGGIEILFSRGIYLIVGVIFLIVGLVMLSRPVREGIVEGVKEGLEG